jgi:diguanylate cyclase
MLRLRAALDGIICVALKLLAEVPKCARNRVKQTSMLLMSHIATPTFHDTPVVRAVERGYRLRLLAFGLGFVAAAVVLTSDGTSFVLPFMLAVNASLWPGIARAFALHGADSHAVEKRNLLIDSAMGGGWVALMQFNLLPCVLLTAVLACGSAMAGGWSLLARGLIVQAAACVLTLALHGLTFAPQSSTLQILACLPLLIAYPLAIALRAHRHGLEIAPAAGEFTADTRIA